MSQAARHPDEQQRLAALARYGVLDTPPEPAFDALTRLAAHICDAPIAVINFVDRERQWFKSEIGLGVRETPLDISICAHAILQPGLFIVPDTRDDARFANNPLVEGKPHLRFYAGALLETEDGFPLGTFCVLDHQPRELDAQQQQALKDLAHQTMLLLELMRLNARQAETLRELEAARIELTTQASTDSLTGLANRRALDETLSRELARQQRHARPAALMMADLDHFKRINDEHGHAVGDEVLQHFARLCRDNLRTEDFIARWGGEEFIAILPESTPQHALAVAERLRGALAARAIPTSAGAIPVTVSIGIAALSGTLDARQALQDVDRALYRAKQRGRNACVASD